MGCLFQFIGMMMLAVAFVGIIMVLSPLLFFIGVLYLLAKMVS